MKKLERFNLQIEYLTEIDNLSKKEFKTKHEVLNDILQQHFNNRDNRLSNHIAREIENLILFQIMNKDVSNNMTIEEIKQECNVINSKKKEYLKEKKEKNNSQFKTDKETIEDLKSQIEQLKTENKTLKEEELYFNEMKSVINLDSLNNIKNVDEMKNKCREIKTIVRKYEEVEEVQNEQ
ncbi:hypothetical protein [Sulfurimonas sp.]|uniref:hypothetical protein n=1 Tax=Sulfurimonas sp. TaxID=2022749 RepID=UPI0025E577F0|nr:hypothetical protein [Sulfurimonas sp.]MBW6487699.1 hypothetical protein [Sulfurimonas sp.]